MFLGIQQLPSRNLTDVSLHRLISDVPQLLDIPTIIEPGISPDEETVQRLQLCTSLTTMMDLMKWDMEKQKQTRSLVFTIRPSRLNIGGRRIRSPKYAFLCVVCRSVDD